MDSNTPSDIGNEGKSNLKDAASFLLRGGSLLGSPCAKCNGVQIRYKDETICINCGERQPPDKITTEHTSDNQVSTIDVDQSYNNYSFLSQSFEVVIKERITEQFKFLKLESNDADNEKRRIEIIVMYLDLLDRLRKYPKNIQK